MMPWPLHCKIREEPIHKKGTSESIPWKVVFLQLSTPNYMGSEWFCLAVYTGMDIWRGGGGGGG